MRPAAPFRKLSGFEAGPVMNTPLYPDDPFCVVTSSCAARGRPAAIAYRKSTADDCKRKPAQKYRQGSKKSILHFGISFELGKLILDFGVRMGGDRRSPARASELYRQVGQQQVISGFS